MEQFEYLYTDFGKNLDKNRPLPEYPRPQMERDSYFNLNGAWRYAILSNCEILRGVPRRLSWFPSLPKAC